MPALRHELTVQAPVDQVFYLLQDEESFHLWLDCVESAEFEDVHKRVGTRFVQHVREGNDVHTYRGQIIVFSPPFHFASRFGNSAFEIEAHYRLRPAGDGCILTFEADMVRTNWVVTLVDNLFHQLSMRIVRRHLQLLKGLAEQGIYSVTNQAV